MLVQIINCPSCTRKLRVPEDLLGKQVRCPTCGHTFTATLTHESVTAPPAAPDALAKKLSPEDAGSAPAAAGEVPAVASQADSAAKTSEQNDFRPCPYCGENIRLAATRCRYCGEAVGEEEEEDDRPWERSRRRTRLDAEPHRGTLVLVFGILSLVMGGIGLPLGIVAMVMGRNDLKKMDAKMMDPEGRSLTQAGWVCGIIGTIWQSLMCMCMVAYVGIFFTAFFGAMAKGPGFAPAPPVTTPRPPAPGR